MTPDMTPERVYHCDLAWLGGDLPAGDVRIDVVGGTIVKVASGEVAPPGAVRLAGLTLPGLANGHSHAFHRALRGRTHAGSGTFWTWRDQMYRLASALDPDSYFALARATFAEMALAGITCVGEFHYLHHTPDGRPYDDPNAIGAALIAAAEEAGVRLTLLDTCYLGSGIGEDGSLLAPSSVQRRFSDADVHRWAARVEQIGEGAMHRVGAAVHSVRAVDPASIAAVAAWAADRGRPLHAHVSEQPAENQQCRAAHGRSPVGLLDSCGALTQRFTAVHATHVDEADIGLLGRSGACVCMCPTTERDLADGIAPTPAMAAQSVAISLGSDSHAVIDLFEEARAVELDTRLTTLSRGNHSVVDLATAATTAGHRSLGWPEAGRIEVGAPADLTTVSLRSVRTAGSTPASALAAVVFAATAADVTDVIVAGRPVVSAGRHGSIDVAAELHTAILAVWKQADQPDVPR